MIAFGRRFDVCKLPLDIFRLDLRKLLSVELEVPIKNPLVSVDGARAVFLPASVQILLNRFIPTDGARPKLAQRHLSEDALSFLTGIRE